MGSVSNTGVQNLLQLLSSTNSPLLSSPGIQSELENASPQDVVEISMSAIQLQGMDTLLGISSGDTSDNSGLSSIISDITSAQTTGTSSSTSTQSSTSTTADQIAHSQAALQAAEGQTLFGTQSTNDSDPLLDFTA